MASRSFSEVLKKITSNAKSEYSGVTKSSSTSSSTSSSEVNAISSTNSTNVKESVKKKYSSVSGKNKLNGTLFPNLINGANNIIGSANTQKANTKLKE